LIGLEADANARLALKLLREIGLLGRVANRGGKAWRLRERRAMS